MSDAAQVLVIDDEPATVRLLVELLRGSGFALRVALAAEDGWQKAVTHQPDAILLDICMPALDGLHLCRLLKDDPRTADIPVLLLTGRVAPQDKLAGFHAGASDYITKPYQADELIARLRVHQGIRRRLRALGAGEPVPAADPAAMRPSVRPAGSPGPSHPHSPIPDPAAAGTADRRDDAAEPCRADRLLQRAVATLRADLAEPPSLVELARRIGTNERTLTALFRQRYGRPVFAWLREERFARACDLLLHDDRDIGSVAGEVGYASAAAFATAFRERFGMTPGRYRRSAGLGPGDAAVRDGRPGAAAGT